jgi:hypothetical protein
MIAEPPGAADRSLQRIEVCGHMAGFGLIRDEYLIVAGGKLAGASPAVG